MRTIAFVLSLALAAAYAAACTPPGQTGTTPAGQTMTPDQIVTNINMLTMKSQALQAPAESINIVNGPLLAVGLGPFPQIITGFADIVSTATTAIAAMQGMPPVGAGAQADAIFNAFRDFVRVHQALLKILIGKAGLFQTVPFVGAPIAEVLRQIENVVDTIAFALINTVQSRAADLQAQASSLKGTLDVSISSYQGLSLGGSASGSTSGGIVGSLGGTLGGVLGR